MIGIAFSERLRWEESNSSATCGWDFGVIWGYGLHCHFAGLVRSGYLAPFRLESIRKGSVKGNQYKQEVKEMFFRRYPQMHRGAE